MSSSSSFQTEGRFNPRPSLLGQGTDIQDLIRSNLGIAGSQALAPVSRSLLADSNGTKRLKAQRQQWGLLLQDQLTGNFGANEKLIRELGGATLDFSPEEKEAWEAAYRSLTDPPSELSSEQRQELRGQLSLPPIPDPNVTRRFSSSRFLMLGPNTEPPIRESEVPISSLALSTGNFVDFLRAFAVDTERFLDQVHILCLSDLVINAYLETTANASTQVRQPNLRRNPILDLAGTPRGLLLCCLVLRGARDSLLAPISTPTWKFVQDPALTRCMILAGYKFSSPPPSGLPLLHHFFGEAYWTVESRKALERPIGLEKEQALRFCRNLFSNLRMIVDSIEVTPELSKFYTDKVSEYDPENALISDICKYLLEKFNLQSKPKVEAELRANSYNFL